MKLLHILVLLAVVCVSNAAVSPVGPQPAALNGLAPMFATNITISSAVAVSGAVLTNNGDYATSTQLINVGMPAMGSNDVMLFSYEVHRKFANTTALNLAFAVGTGTNTVRYDSGVIPLAAGVSQQNPTGIFYNVGSTTNQLAVGSSGTFGLGGFNAVDTSTNGWPLRLNCWTTTSFTNGVFALRFYKLRF